MPTILIASLVAAFSPGFAGAESTANPGFADKLVEPYLKIQVSLADDELSGARKGAESFLSMLDDGKPSESLAALRGPAQSLADSEDIAGAREAFLELSNGFIEVIKAKGAADDLTLYVAHCPMAFGNKGADWLQSETTVANPYYGDRMLRCGMIREEIGQPQ